MKQLRWTAVVAIALARVGANAAQAASTLYTTAQFSLWSNLRLHCGQNGSR